MLIFISWSVYFFFIPKTPITVFDIYDKHLVKWSTYFKANNDTTIHNTNKKTITNSCEIDVALKAIISEFGLIANTLFVFRDYE